MNLFLETVWVHILFYYYILEAIVLFFVPSRYRTKNVKGQVVLITGAGSGLGRLMAHRFGRLGCKLVLWDMNTESNEQTATELQEMNVEAHTYTCDIANSDSVYRAANKVKTEVGSVDILVNNAGVVTGMKILDCSDAMMRKTMDVNATAHFWMVKAFLPDMLAINRGHVVTIASVAGLFGTSNLADYCASKFAAVGFHESLTSELYVLKKSGIRTTLVCPYFINTGMFEGCKTRFPSILPVLEQEDVADEIVNAVLINQDVLILPRNMHVSCVIKSMVPVKAQLLINDFLGAGTFMDEFRGRAKRD